MVSIHAVHESGYATAVALGYGRPFAGFGERVAIEPRPFVCLTT